MHPSHRVLIIADASAEMIEHALSRVGMPLMLRRHDPLAADIVSALRDFQPDLVLMEHQHSSSSPGESLASVRGECPDARIILVVPQAVEEETVAVIGRDTEDYVLRESPGRLPFAIRRALWNHVAHAGTSEMAYQAHVLENVSDAVLATDEKDRITAWNRAAAEMYGWPAEEALGLPAPTILTSEHVGTTRREALQILHEQGRYRGEAVQHNRDGRPIMVEMIVILLRDEQGRPTGAVSVNRDITERKLAEKALRQQSERLEILHQIDQAILIAQSPQATAHAAVQKIREIVPCQRASVLTYDYEAGRARVLAVDADQEALLPAGSSLAIEELTFPREHLHGEPLMCNDCDLDLAHPVDFQALRAAGVQSYLSVPLMPGGRLIGCLNLSSDQKGAFGDHAVEVACQVAASLAVAIHNASLFEQVQASRERLRQFSRRLVEVQENERKHIAQELHDEAGQSLTLLKLGLGMLERNAHDPVAVTARALVLKQTVDGVLDDLHRLAVNLRPASLDRVGLCAAVEQYVAQLRETSGLDIRVVTRGLDHDRLPAEVETAIYRVVQEALTNVVRHADARRAGVILERRAEELVAIVEDDGKGFDLDNGMPQDRLGLSGMRERAEMLGGVFTVESSVDSGTSIIVEVPCFEDDSCA